MLSQATAYFDNKEYKKCRTESNSIIEKHSGSNEAKKAKELLEKANEELNKIAETKEKEKAEKIKKDKLRMANATKKMRKKADDMNDITWYYDKTSPSYVNSRTNFYTYIGKKRRGNTLDANGNSICC